MGGAVSVLRVGHGVRLPLSVLRVRAEGGNFAVFLKWELLTMQSILEILKVDTNSGIAKKSGQPYSITEAHCILREADGSVGAVGLLVVPKLLVPKAVPGLYTASFGLVTGRMGEDQGRIVARLADLTPIDRRTGMPVAGVPVAAQGKVPA